MEDCSGYRLVFIAKGKGGFSKMNKWSFHLFTANLSEPDHRRTKRAGALKCLPQPGRQKILLGSDV